MIPDPTSQPWLQYLPAGASPASVQLAKTSWSRGVRPHRVGNKWVWDTTGAAAGAKMGAGAGVTQPSSEYHGPSAIGGPVTPQSPTSQAVAAATPTGASVTPAAPTDATPGITDLIKSDPRYVQATFGAGATIADAIRQYGIDPTPYLDTEVMTATGKVRIRDLLGTDAGLRDAARTGQQNPTSVLAMLRGETSQNHAHIGSDAASRGALFSSAYQNTDQRENQAYAGRVGQAGQNFASIINKAIGGIQGAGNDAYDYYSANPPTAADAVRATVAPTQGTLSSVPSGGERHGLDTIKPVGVVAPKPAPKPKVVKATPGYASRAL